MKKHIRICYTNFWEGFDPEQCAITYFLREVYDVEICKIPNEKLDLLIMSLFGDTNKTLKYFSGQIKILQLIAENTYPNFNTVDYTISHYDLGFNRNLRYPHWAYRDFERRHNYYEPRTFQFQNQIEFTDDLFDNRSNDIPMAISNDYREGINIVEQLFEKFKINSCGKWLNNVPPIGDKIESKIQYFNKFKFSLAFENATNDGYVTEKLYESFVANTIPIYFGCDDAKKDFNPKAFIHVRDYDNIDDLVNAIKEVMYDKERYKEMITQKRIINYVDYDARLKEFLINIIENGRVFNHYFGAIGWIRYDIYHNN